MNDKSRIIQFWGICDLLFIAWWVGRTLLRGNIPIYFEIKSALALSSSFGDSWPIFATIFALAMYFSIIYSGKLLIQLDPKAAIVTYIQLPFRFFAITPSLFFAIWPVQYFFTGNKQIFIAGTIIVFISEAAKIASIITWHKEIKENLITSQLTQTGRTFAA